MTSVHLSLATPRLMGEELNADGGSMAFRERSSRSMYCCRRDVSLASFPPGDAGCGDDIPSWRPSSRGEDVKERRFEVKAETDEGGDQKRLSAGEEDDRTSADGSADYFQWTYNLRCAPILTDIYPSSNRFHIEHVPDKETVDNEDADADRDEAEAPISFPWRSNVETPVLEDASKYLMEDDINESSEDLATPQIKSFADNDGDHPLASFQHSSSTSSFLLHRPDLSNCQSELCYSRWLNEAESHHSETHPGQHHHVLDCPGLETRSSGQGRHRIDPTDQDRHSSSTRVDLDLHLDLDGDEEDQVSSHDQVLHWLLTNDLTVELDSLVVDADETLNDDSNNNNLQSQ